ncbi:MAG: glutamyl-tRNA amidotransferase [Rhizobiales bacterium PAR1]|nr:MAG: glutamyl-tRNA amidotransferase [Rhizobiales bacterium PAR1]
MAGFGRVRRTIESALGRIAEHDEGMKAFLTVDAEGARAAAEVLDHLPPRGPLHGLPVAIKDLTDTAGLRTTYGSALFAQNVPASDDLIVARLRAAGAIILGKTMTPEFGFGALCRNPLGGPTANPWQTDLTSGGSSGGAAVAVATGMVPLAHGTDFGGSVRTPASFCGVLSIRPTPGVLPNPARALGYDMLSTTGFLARSVAMLTRALKVTAGPDALDPLSISLPKASVALPEGPLRIAVTDDFGTAPVAEGVRERLRAAVGAIPPDLGTLTTATPDCIDAYDIFHTLRPALIRRQFGPLMEKFGDDLTQTVRWWIDRGAGISAADFLAAEAGRTALARRFVRLFEHFDVLIAPAASVMPWPNSLPEVTDIDGKALATIVDYLAVTFIVTLAGCPVVTLPAPLGGEKLPFGIQLIGPPGSDYRLLRIAARFEKAGFRFVPPPRYR